MENNLCFQGGKVIVELSSGPEGRWILPTAWFRAISKIFDTTLSKEWNPLPPAGVCVDVRIDATFAPRYNASTRTWNLELKVSIISCMVNRD